MTNKNKKHSHSRATFWKVWISLFVTMLIFLFIFQINAGKTSNLNSTEWNEGELKNYSKIIVASIERKLVEDKIDALLNMTEHPIEQGSSQTESLLKDWLKLYPDVISVSFRLVRAQQSIRLYKEGFLNEINVKSLSPEKREKLIGFVFKENESIDTTQKWYPGPILDGSILGYPIYSIQIPVKNRKNYESIDIKFKLKT